jgi:sugar phosphate isomerase/epimerase
MQISDGVHLTYCTNIHAGETWEEVFQSLQAYVPPLKQRLSPGQPFGVGLRLSDLASRALIEPETLLSFRNWLIDNGLYVALINGFPYGGFHGQHVKDDVHRPDWNTLERRDYTIRLAQILEQLLETAPFPDLEGGISTSPISYRPWHTAETTDSVLENGCAHMAEVVLELARIAMEKGKVIHLDIEPEPDGMIDHVQDTVDFFNQKLIPMVTSYLAENLSITREKAEDLARRHLQLCYDVCHFAVMYEDPAAAIKAFEKNGIRIGRVQISAALKADLPTNPADREPIAKAFQNLAESTYLHQVSAKYSEFGVRNSEFGQYPDLPEALPHIREPDVTEWRTHFHVPVFVKNFGPLQSTQDDILEIVSLQKQKPFTRHWEVETYTWEVLPDTLKISLLDSIEREMRWVLANIEAQ